jgi:hypothetical protein
MPSNKVLHGMMRREIAEAVGGVNTNLAAITNPAIVVVGESKTLALTDAGKVLKVTAAATITVPLNAAVAFAIGAEIVILSYTASDVAIVPDTNVTLYSASSNRKINGQYSAVTLKKMATDEWALIGALKA